MASMKPWMRALRGLALRAPRIRPAGALLIVLLLPPLLAMLLEAGRRQEASAASGESPQGHKGLRVPAVCAGVAAGQETPGALCVPLLPGSRNSLSPPFPELQAELVVRSPEEEDGKSRLGLAVHGPFKAPVTSSSSQRR